MSLALPGVNGTTMRTGPVGYVWATASDKTAALAAIAMAITNADTRDLMVPPATAGAIEAARRSPIMTWRATNSQRDTCTMPMQQTSMRSMMDIRAATRRAFSVRCSLTSEGERK